LQYELGAVFIVIEGGNPRVASVKKRGGNSVKKLKHRRKLSEGRKKGR